MPKNIALQKIESHEKLCRIMQKQTHQSIANIQAEIKTIKEHMLYSVAALVSGMFGIILVLLQKL